MARINQDFTLYAGEDKQINFTITDENGVAIDLVGSTAVWVLARITSTPEILITKRSTVSTQIDYTDNTYHIYLEDVDTDLLHGKYAHELRMVNADGQESVLATGQVRIYDSLTKEL
jgi:hypothetical protein